MCHNEIQTSEPYPLLLHLYYKNPFKYTPCIHSADRHSVSCPQTLLYVCLWQEVCKKPPSMFTSEGRCQGLLWWIQPHLINNIIVLLHTAIKSHPPPFPFLFSFLSFYFRLWHRAVLWHGWARVTLPPSTETKHKSRARRLRQKTQQHLIRQKT